MLSLNVVRFMLVFNGSFTSLDIRRIALCPSVVNGIKVDETFDECSSPALRENHSSCVFKVRLSGCSFSMSC